MDYLVVNKNGLRFRVIKIKYDWFWEIVMNDEWEPQTYRLFDRLISPEHTYLDIGAWIGPTVLYAAQLAKKAYAFEPDPAAYNELTQNLQANPDIKNVKACNCFVGSTNGKIKMGSRGEGGDSLSSILFKNEKTSWFAESIRLEDIIRKENLQSPMFIKIDIEGGEYSLIPHLSKVIKKYQPTLYISLHPFLLKQMIKGRSLWARVRQRHLLFKKHLRLVIGLRKSRFIYDIDGNKINLWTRLINVWLHGTLVKENSIVAMGTVWEENGDNSM